MTQNYPPRQLNPFPQGMPIIPPRLQQQQQQEVLEKHRRRNQLQQAQGTFPIQSNHNRSMSNGNGSAAPARHRPVENLSSSNNYSNNNSNNSSNSNYNNHSNNNNIVRLRSESNPTYSSNSSNSINSNNSSNSNNSGNTYESLWATSNHTRANSSGSTASGYSARVVLSNRSNTTGSSFQERMRERDRQKQQQEREEREAEVRALHPTLHALSQTPTSAPPPTNHKAGTAIWNKLRAAKDVINATITGEERWPDSDDSDYEGESHVSRVLREHADKKEADIIAAKIAELEMMDSTHSNAPNIPARSASSSRNRLRNALQRNNSNSNSSPAGGPSADTYGQSLGSINERGESGHQFSRSENSVRNGETKTGGALTSTGVSAIRLNRFRTSSDASLSEALGRLEGKRNQDALVAQVSHLGSTRARSPHRGNRAYKDNIDTVPPPPLPTPKSSYRQQQQQQQQQQGQYQPSLSPPSSSSSLTSSSSRRNNNLGNHGQRKQQQEQQQQQSNYI
ncbi:hypothetical protein BGZ49_007919 [Haplosporangium sp. Z 27]|nr:hypothetical protein BGZ49_007919 [Haplosporangium sp. Z 27]